MFKNFAKKILVAHFMWLLSILIALNHDGVSLLLSELIKLS